MSRKASTSDGSRGAPPAAEDSGDSPNAESCRGGFWEVILVWRLGDMMGEMGEFKNSKISTEEGEGGLTRERSEQRVEIRVDQDGAGAEVC